MMLRMSGWVTEELRGRHLAVSSALVSCLVVVLVLGTATATRVLACEAMRGGEYEDPPEVVQLQLSPARWHVVRRGWADEFARKEWVPPDQTLASWQRLVSWHVAFGHEATDLETAERDFLKALASQCNTHEHQSIQTNPVDRIFEWWDDGCFGRAAQHQLVRLVRGKTGVHTVSYSFKGGRLEPEERGTWIGRIASMPLVLRSATDAAPAVAEIRTAVWAGEYERAVDRLAPLVEAEDAAAEALLAQLHVEGWGVEQDYARARELLERASGRGDARATFDLGQLYELALGVEADPAKALQLYRLAAERGLAEAQGRVGYLLLNGPPSLADPAASYRWFELALTNGHTHARYWLGRLHEIGIGAPKDVLRASELYAQSARDGEPEAQYRLGVLYASGNGVPKDLDVARLWLMRAAGQGNESARAFYLQLDAADS